MSEQLWLPSWLATISMSISVAILWSVRRAKQQKMTISHVLDLGLIMMLAAFIGGRLFHVLLEQPRFYFENPLLIFQFWEGGFVYFGGIMSALFAGFVLCRIRQWPWLQYANFFAPILALTYAVGRVGCFLNGCCYGKACDLPWAVTFHQHAPYGIDLIPRHPTQIYALIGELLILTILLVIERRHTQKSFFQQWAQQHLIFVWLGLHALNRLIMEYYRDDFRGSEIGGLSWGQWISIALLLISLLKLTRASISQHKQN
jgi:phosphatidylglycerol---prolipoprotein diacylglyceryl transferase